MKTCVHCGERIEFFRVPAHHEIAKDHPYRMEYETFGGWWIHTSGVARYLRNCAFGETIADCMANYAKFRGAKAEPSNEREDAA
jgi:hypothetical protein